MPLGFARSILTKPAAAAGRPYFQSASIVGSGNHAGLLLDGTTSTAYQTFVRNYTIAFWFNCSSSQLDTGTQGRIIDWQGGTSPNFDQNQFTVFITGTGITIFWIQNTYGTASYTVSPTSWSTNYLNSQWHHVMISLSLSSSSTKQCYIDGVSQTVSGTDNPTQTPAFGRYASMFYDTNNNTTYTTVDQYGGKLHYLYLDNAALDLSVSSNRTKFYNSGYVDLGTSGTSSGLTQPDIFIYVNSSNVITNGGTMSNTITTAKEGIGSITISATGGP